ncbi:hypothetical protein SAMN04489712_1433 [Thermomonospora echinospora]|uniref:Relaxase/Mobilisation nuclease domain-containing protein n=1 Tax=Thermomonospora echinospora TaxID=1992 RepID=A0A1H6E8M4_9ACTN|nr:hypothetical protein [Thermomonospora echinospora]SEG94072.1 hypothetical protein SAMN04489712_1433 [Thermomonospora echinospora]
MIGSIERIVDVAALIEFLFGPGEGERHENPRLVGGYPDLFLEPFLEPEPRADGSWDCGFLIRTLQPPKDRDDLVAEPIWHCELRTWPGEGVLSDDEWGQVALEVAIQNGVAIDDEDHASIAPWTAIRHAEDHIHIVMCLYGFEGRQLYLSRDRLQVPHACAIVEDRHRLWARRLRSLDERHLDDENPDDPAAR